MLVYIPQTDEAAAVWLKWFTQYPGLRMVIAMSPRFLHLSKDAHLKAQFQALQKRDGWKSLCKYPTPPSSRSWWTPFRSRCFRPGGAHSQSFLCLSRGCRPTDRPVESGLFPAMELSAARLRPLFWSRQSKTHFVIGKTRVWVDGGGLAGAGGGWSLSIRLFGIWDGAPSGRLADTIVVCGMNEKCGTTRWRAGS